MEASGVTNRTAPSRRLSRLRLAIAVHLFMTIAYFMPGASWSPASRFALTRAIVEHGTLEITPYVDSTGDRAQVGQRYFSDKAPVPSLLAVPAYSVFYAVAKLRHRTPAFRAETTAPDPPSRVRVSPAYAKGLYVSGLSTSGLSAVFLALSLFEVLRRRLKVKTAPLAALVTVLGTPLFPYATSFFGHTIAGAFLFAAFALVDPLGPASTRKRLAGAGALLVLAGGSEYVVFAPAVFVALYAILKAPEARRIETALFLAAGAALPLALLSAYHSLCFGAPWRTGYAFITNPEFAPGQAQGLFGITYPRLEALYGVLFGSSRGLLYLSPLCAVALVAAWLHRRDRDPALSVGILVFAILLLINASYYRWEGGLSTGPRHLVPALGFLGVAIGLSFEQPNLRTIAAVAAGVSCSIMILITALAVEVPPNIDAIFDYLLPQFEQGFVAHITGASNLGIAVGLGRKASVVPPLVWAMAGGVFVARLSARSTPESPSGDDP